MKVKDGNAGIVYVCKVCGIKFIRYDTTEPKMCEACEKKRCAST